MSLIHHNVKKLEEINILLEKLPEELFIRPKEVLSGSSIGQHFRHILEFYICLIKGLDTGIISYDSRERNIEIETDKNTASKIIMEIIYFFNSVQCNRNLIFSASYSSISGEPNTEISTTLYREFAYALDHTIHHLAIVKIALSEEKETAIISKNLGVAPSTIRYRDQCAQ